MASWVRTASVKSWFRSLSLVYISRQGGATKTRR